MLSFVAVHIGGKEVKVNTSRFGDLEVDKKDIINFTEGLLGFDQLTRFFVVDPGDQTLILWLQSVDDAKVAFPVLEPRVFSPNFTLQLLPSELNSLNLSPTESDIGVYTILTIPQDITQMSANMKAPIVINNKQKIARQIVLQDSKLEVKHPMYLDLKRYIVNYSSDDSRRTVVTAIPSEEIVSEITVNIDDLNLDSRKADLEA